MANFFDKIGAYRLGVGGINTDMNMWDVMDLCPYPIGCYYPNGEQSSYCCSNINAWLYIQCKGGSFFCEADDLPEYLEVTDEMLWKANHPSDIDLPEILED